MLHACQPIQTTIFVDQTLYLVHKCPGSMNIQIKCYVNIMGISVWHQIFFHIYAHNFLHFPLCNFKFHIDMYICTTHVLVNFQVTVKKYFNLIAIFVLSHLFPNDCHNNYLCQQNLNHLVHKLQIYIYICIYVMFICTWGIVAL